MGTPYVTNAALFLIKTLFGLYILAVMLRLLLQWVRADFYNPLAQFIVRVTNPPLVPLRRFIPGLGGIDLASVVLLFALQLAEFVLTGWLGGLPLRPAGLLVLSAAELLSLLFYVYLFSILIQAVLSWVAPATYNPVSPLLHQINEPLLAPARRLIPPIAGLDLSPLVVLVALQLVNILLISPLRDMGTTMIMTGG